MRHKSRSSKTHRTKNKDIDNRIKLIHRYYMLIKQMHDRQFDKKSLLPPNYKLYKRLIEKSGRLKSTKKKRIDYPHPSDLYDIKKELHKIDKKAKTVACEHRA